MSYHKHIVIGFTNQYTLVCVKC